MTITLQNGQLPDGLLSGTAAFADSAIKPNTDITVTIVNSNGATIFGDYNKNQLLGNIQTLISNINNQVVNLQTQATQLSDLNERIGAVILA